jgi:hypothetical protein
MKRKIAKLAPHRNEIGVLPDVPSVGRSAASR